MMPLYPNDLEALKRFVRDEVRVMLRDIEGNTQVQRMDALEHLLKSYQDFVDNPHIAGDTFAAINAYAYALSQKAQTLLEDE